MGLSSLDKTIINCYVVLVLGEVKKLDDVPERYKILVAEEIDKKVRESL